MCVFWVFHRLAKMLMQLRAVERGGGVKGGQPLGQQLFQWQCDIVAVSAWQGNAPK